VPLPSPLFFPFWIYFVVDRGNLVSGRACLVLFFFPPPLLPDHSRDGVFPLFPFFLRHFFHHLERRLEVHHPFPPPFSTTGTRGNGRSRVPFSFPLRTMGFSPAGDRTASSLPSLPTSNRMCSNPCLFFFFPTCLLPFRREKR